MLLLLKICTVQRYGCWVTPLCSIYSSSNLRALIDSILIT